MNRRRSARTAACLPFDVYCHSRRLGRFWTRNVSQEGLFLSTGSIEGFNNAILELRFRSKGLHHCLRGVVVQQIRGKGVGIQLSYWRRDARPAHLAYLEYTLPKRSYEAA